MNIELPMEYAYKILDIYGYQSEEILAYFNNLTNELSSYKLRIAYKDRPSCLDKDIIMIDDVDGMQFDVVINKLFNQLLMERLF